MLFTSAETMAMPISTTRPCRTQQGRKYGISCMYSMQKPIGVFRPFLQLLYTKPSKHERLFLCYNLSVTFRTARVLTCCGIVGKIKFLFDITSIPAFISYLRFISTMYYNYNKCIVTEVFKLFDRRLFHFLTKIF